MTSHKQAVGYLRVSTSKQANEGISLEAQEEKIRTWCSYYDYVLVGVYTDAGLSGSKYENRPSLHSALKACKKGIALVTYALSRLTRSTKDLLEISERLEKQGADLVSVSENIDTTSAAGKMVFRMLGVIAEFEKDIIGERTSLAMQAKKTKGEYTGGKVPYGYQLSQNGKTLHKIQVEQEVIWVAKEWRKHGRTLEYIADELCKLGYCSRTNKRFTPTQISRMLMK
jgi:site-specific DNA recombinase